MSGGESREELLLRIGPERNAKVKSGPLIWEDLASLVHRLILAARPLMRATAAVTERHSLGPRGAWMLNLIGAGLVYPHQLANVFEIGRSLVSGELARLSEAGLMVSKPGRDRRRTELALTDAGQAAVAEVRAELERILREALAGYSPDEVRLCTRMLRDLRDARDG